MTLMCFEQLELHVPPPPYYYWKDPFCSDFGWLICLETPRTFFSTQMVSTDTSRKKSRRQTQNEIARAGIEGRRRR